MPDPQTPNDHFLAFDPNSKPSKVWATYVPYRSPSWKLYVNRGGAISAMAVGSSWRSKRAAALFFHDGEKWVRVAYKLPDPPHECSLCRDNVTRPASNQYLLQRDPSAVDNFGLYRWLRDHKGKVADPPELHFVCKSCADRPEYQS